jgi:hypothetical protein
MEMEEVISLPSVKAEEEAGEEEMEDIHEEGEYSDEAYPLDEVKDDELEQILQQTVPLDQQNENHPAVSKAKASFNFSSLPSQEEEAKTSKKREREVVITPSPSVQKKASPTKLKVLPLDALLKRERPVRYFIMKSVDTKNLAIALSKNIWSTQAHNEKKLREAYQDNEVILIFSVNQSGGFQGYARMVSGIGSKSCTIWEKDSEKWGGLFYLEWICQRELNFHKTQGMTNPLNENMPLKISRDGQELEPSVAYKLCQLLNLGNEYDVNDIILKHLPGPNDKYQQQQQFKRPKKDYDNDRDDSNSNQRPKSFTPQNNRGPRDQPPNFMKAQGGFVPNTITPMILARNMIETPSSMNPLFTLGPLTAISGTNQGNPFAVPYTSGMANMNRGTTFYSRTDGPSMNQYGQKVHINPMGMGYNGGMMPMRPSNYSSNNNNYNSNNYNNNFKSNNNYSNNYNNNFENSDLRDQRRYRNNANNYKNRNFHQNHNNSNGSTSYNNKPVVKSEAFEVITKNRTQTTYYEGRNNK